MGKQVSRPRVGKTQKLLQDYGHVILYYGERRPERKREPVVGRQVNVGPGLSGIAELIKRYKASPVRNPRPDVKLVEVCASRAREEEYASAETGIYPTRAHPVSERIGREVTYELGQTQALLEELAARGRFLPSRTLAVAFLNASERVTEHFRKSLSFLPAKLFTVEGAPGGAPVEQVRESVARTVQGALEAMAYRAAAFGGGHVQVSDSKGEFVESFSRVLVERFPIRAYDLPRLLGVLHEELEVYARKNPALAKWGSLHVGPAGLFLRVLVVLPSKPPTGGAIAVGGVTAQ